MYGSVHYCSAMADFPSHFLISNCAHEQYTFHRCSTVLTKHPETLISIAEELPLVKHWPFCPNSNRDKCALNVCAYIIRFQ